MANSSSRKMWASVVFTSFWTLALGQDSQTEKGSKNPLHYLPNYGAAAVGLIFMILLLATHTFLTIKTRAKYMIVLLVAEACYAVGIAIRFPFHQNPDTLITYVILNLFTTLAPCGFIAAEYMILGRLARWVKGERHLLIRPSRLTKVFVTSDVVTFLIQAAGGGLSAQADGDPNKAKFGADIFLAGLILQLVSFAFFTSIFLLFAYRMRTNEPQTWERDHIYGLPWKRDWRTFILAMGLSCIGVLVRSVYRCIELSQGYTGHLTTTEWYFWVFDFVPLYLALSVYIPFWPGFFINRDTPIEAAGHQLEPASTTTLSTPELGGGKYKSHVYEDRHEQSRMYGPR
ncbi:RTA1 like protein-domain-containing protein [Irpex lacteus]|nr:RTA1 like protein-domain-containing protein [Irpex lacteus]